MLITPGFTEKRLIVEQFQGNYLKDVRAQKLPTHRFFLKLGLTAENDKIR